jgi:competence protein ComEC
VQRLWQAGRLSFWVWLITAPLVWHQFHIVTPISVVANLLLSGPLLVALISGLTTVCCGLIWTPLAIAPAWGCRLALTVIDGGVEWLAAIPGGHFWLPAPPGWWIVIFYLLGPVGGWLLPGRTRSRWLAGGLLAWFAIALTLATVGRRCWLEAPPAGTLEIVFIDVGHGTSVLLRHPTAGDWLYDCGRLGDPAQSARPIEGVLWQKGIRHLDGILLSHADSDHYNALPTLLRRFSIGRVITAPGVLETDEPGLHAVREALRHAGVPVDEGIAGDVLFRTATGDRSGDAAIDAAVDGSAWGRLLHPPARFVASLDNARSLVLQVDHAGRSLVLPGDVEWPGTDTLLRCPRPPPGGILMAPHHGSLQQSPRPILDWARPATVIVSGSERADRPAVYRALRQSGAEVYVTAACGAITLRIDPQGRLAVTPWFDDSQ